MARPLKQIDENLVLNLASIMCTMKEIATICDCSVDTLENRFSEVINKGRETGKSSLRRFQFAAAEKGNPAMLIWLGKQHLGQRDDRFIISEDEQKRKEVEKLSTEQLLELVKDDVKTA